MWVIMITFQQVCDGSRNCLILNTVMVVRSLTCPYTVYGAAEHQMCGSATLFLCRALRARRHILKCGAGNDLLDITEFRFIQVDSSLLFFT